MPQTNAQLKGTRAFLFFCSHTDLQVQCGRDSYAFHYRVHAQLLFGMLKCICRLVVSFIGFSNHIFLSGFIYRAPWRCMLDMISHSYVMCSMETIFFRWTNIQYLIWIHTKCMRVNDRNAKLSNVIRLKTFNFLRNFWIKSQNFPVEGMQNWYKEIDKFFVLKIWLKNKFLNEIFDDNFNAV